MRLLLALALTVAMTPSLAQTPVPPAHHRGLPDFPWKAADAAPPVAGLSLGAPQSTLASLGSPDAPDAAGQKPGAETVLHFAGKGLEVHVASGALTTIKLLTPTAGAVGTLHVGDTLKTLVTVWGKPHTVAGPFAIYSNGQFLAVAEIGPEDGLIHSLQITRTFTP